MNRVHKFNRLFIFLLILFISIGFAYLTRDLTLSGISSIFGNTWDVHFDNVVVTSGSVEANTPVIDTDRTSVSFTVELSTPGNFYEFTVDAVNGGTIDAMLNTFTSSELDESIANLLEYTVTYADGEELAQYQELNAGDSLTYKIRLYYKLDISEDDLPDSNIPVEITFTTDYIQADSNRIQRYAETHSLYNVLKNEAESGGLAKKYTGAHQDSMDASKSTKDIYHWYADNDTDGTAVTNKNNVIFANHCWQMIRTTDTGGIKLLYNGEVENNQCLNTRSNHVGIGDSYHYSGIEDNSYYYGTDYTYDNESDLFSLAGDISFGQWTAATASNFEYKYTCKSTDINGTCSNLYYVIVPDDNSDTYSSDSSFVNIINSNVNYSTFGSVNYNYNDDSLGYVGYMFNKIYHKNWYYPNTREEVLLSSRIRDYYYYGDDITWDSSTNKWSLVNASSGFNFSEDYTDLVGKYTLMLAADVSHYQAHYIVDVDVDSNTFYYINLTDGHLLDYYIDTYYYSSSFVDNGNGTFSLSDPVSFSRLSWKNNYSDILNKYVCKNISNNTCSDVYYVLKSNNLSFSYLSVSNNINFSSTFSYSNGKYHLDENNMVSFWNLSNSSNYNRINYHHYTCLNNNIECEDIYYVTDIDTFDKRYNLSYVILSNGNDINYAINEMLFNDDVNTKDSLMKVTIEAWYKHYLLRDFDKFIDDTIYCNNRTITTLSGWNPNGGNITNDLYFKENSNKSVLYCDNVNDRFSISNNKAKLNYKVGLMTATEANLMSNHNIIKTGYAYTLMSPTYYREHYSNLQYISTNGYLWDQFANSACGIRPSISLKSNIFYTLGNGSMETPYIVYTN